LVALYLASSTERSGKTTIAAAIGKHLIDRKRRVGYFKPRLLADGGRNPDPDATLMRDILALDEPIGALSPAFADHAALRQGVKTAFGNISGRRDVVIVEGLGELDQHMIDAAMTLEAKVVGIEGYAQRTTSLLESYDELGSRAIGVVLNKVPRSRMEQAKTDLAGAGATILGVIPEDRALLTLTVAELARAIDGNVLSGDGTSSALVENVLLGAMSPDHGPEYYAHRENKAALIRSDRPDMQLAALETSTTCLVLAGKNAPIPMVQRRAEQKGVPVIVADSDIAGVVAKLEIGLKNARLNEAKAVRAAVLVEQHLGMDRFLNNLGLL
jgi:BioD-like phosphotransacetylase family protein